MGAIQKDAQSHNPNGLAMRVGATYQRRLKASEARAWENVLDWEHLPHLHDSSFSELDLQDAGAWGWRAVTRGQPAGSAGETLIELVVDRPNNRYVSRTLEGGIPGMEIWTTVTPVGPRETDIEVEFHIPGMSEPDTDKLGAYMVGLYTTLWDEDEQMMVDRQKALDARRDRNQNSNEPSHEIDLGPSETVRSNLPLTHRHEGHAIRVIEQAGDLRAYLAECPHMLAPLEDIAPDAEGCITCPWHGYRFDTATGKPLNAEDVAPLICLTLDVRDDGHLIARF